MIMRQSVCDDMPRASRTKLIQQDSTPFVNEQADGGLLMQNDLSPGSSLPMIGKGKQGNESDN